MELVIFSCILNRKFGNTSSCNWWNCTRWISFVMIQLRLELWTMGTIFFFVNWHFTQICYIFAYYILWIKLLQKCLISRAVWLWRYNTIFLNSLDGQWIVMVFQIRKFVAIKIIWPYCAILQIWAKMTKILNIQTCITQKQ